MVKGLFLDFYGTVVHENGPISFQVIEKVFKSGNAKSPQEAVSYWGSVFQQKLSQAQGEFHRLQYDLALESFEEALSHFQSNEDPKAICDMMVEHWCNPPIYEDAKSFIANAKLPVYLVTNSDESFISEAVRHHGLSVNGIVTSEQAKYAKPRKEIFLHALSKFGLNPDEVIHVGDSLSGDVACATEAGIRAIWLNRSNDEVPEGITAISGFEQLTERLMK